MLSSLYALLRSKNRIGLLRAAWRVAQNRGIGGLYREYRKFSYLAVAYGKWVKQYDVLTDEDRKAISRDIVAFSYRPLISVLTPTYNTPEKWLRRAIDSVLAQSYQNWELCIADDASSAPHVRLVLDEYVRLDDRIKVVYREQNGHISAATNSALSIARGEFVALLDHDDELPEHALHMVAAELNDKPQLDLIYSDEDKIDEKGRRFDPYFKPDWNPDLLGAQNMISHFGVYRAELLRAIGGFREGVEGSQDWDVALRVAETISSSTIRHIPHVLYHWRAISGSAAAGHEEKSYIASASQRVMREHLQRINQPALVEPAFSSFVRIRYPLPTPAPLVTIILVSETDNSEYLIRLTSYPALEVISYTPLSDETRAETINRAARQARGELLCFLDTKLLPNSGDWLEQLVVHAIRAEIGAVGPLQLDAQGNIQKALMVLRNTSGDDRVLWGFYQGLSSQEKGVAGRAALQQNVTVLAPACLMLRTKTFRMMNGFDATKFPNNLFEPDLCLRLVQAGYRNLWTPYSRMAFTGALKSSSERCDQGEAARFRIQWRDFLDHDPAHNPNLVCDGEWPFPAFPPRIDYPWRK